MKTRRFVALAVIFSIVCLSFLAVFAVEQIKVPYTEDKPYDLRSETVFGARGRIYDRNGVLLVDNIQKYDLIFEYGSMAYTNGEVNAALLECLSILYSTGNKSKRTEQEFPLSGSYPDYSYTKESQNPDSASGKALTKFIKSLSLNPKISADSLKSEMMKKYKLTEEKYSGTEIDELLRIRYDMERKDFGSYAYYTIAEGFEMSNAKDLALITQFKENRIEGANLLQQTGRVYTQGNYAVHILGKTGGITAENKDLFEGYDYDAKVGISGCESAFEAELRGTNGTKFYEYDEEGNLVKEYYDPPPIVGKDVYLTIDINLQKVAEDSIAEKASELGSEAGAVTAVDPDTGEVLVVGSYPNYDISSWNRALFGTYAPGSTYKIGAALAALEEGHIDTDTTHFCDMVYPYLDHPECLGHHGDSDVSKAIKYSCNIFFYYLGHEMTLAQITPYTQELGLGVVTGIELGESKGKIASSQYGEWSAGQDAAGAIGQSYHTYTPLQLSVYMASIVNGGSRYSSHILKCVKTHTGESVSESTSQLAANVKCSQNTYNTLMSAMESVIEANTKLDKYFSNVDSDVACGGKTGTAQIDNEEDNSLFSGYGIRNDKKIVASCVIEKGGEGANAGKIVADIIAEYFSEGDNL